MRKRKDLRAYQSAAEEFVRRVRRGALFVDPGLGKTAITLTAFTGLIDELECGRVLVLAPPRVAKKTWPDEFAEWEHTHEHSYTHIQGSIAQRRKLLQRPTSFHIMSIEMMPWLLKEMGGHAPDRAKIKRILGGNFEPIEGESEADRIARRVRGLIAEGVPASVLEGKDEDGVEKIAERAAKMENKWRPPTRFPYDAIVIDESSKVKEHNTNRFRALRLMSRHVQYMLLLTGTPAANGMTDLWAQLFLIDFGERLGQNITAFRDRWCKENYNGHGYHVQKDFVGLIEERISDVVFTLREEDYANLPPRMYNTINLEFDPVTAEKYKKFERTYVLELAEEKQLTVNNGAAITTKLQQLSNGVVYKTDELGGKEEHFFHDTKLDALADLVNELNGQPVLVAYQFKSDIRRLLKRFPGAELFGKDPTTQDRWNAGEIPMMLVHPKSAAHGLNFQHGGCNGVWYGLPWSLEDYIQLNKRLHRSGQKKPVMIHHLVIAGTMDEDALATLAGKNDMQESLLNALKKRIKLYK